MLKSHQEDKTITDIVVDDIICNKCGKSLKDSCNMNYEGLVEVSLDGGYASKIGDMNRVTFSICEDCLLEIFSTFKIPPEHSNYGAFSGDSIAENDAE